MGKAMPKARDLPLLTDEEQETKGSAPKQKALAFAAMSRVSETPISLDP